MHIKQRRRHERAPARLPVWLNGVRSGNNLQGHTANVSASGMYLLTSGDFGLALGAAVSVTFGIRSEETGGYVLHEASSGAEVVRVERLGYGTGIALKFVEPGFCRCVEQPVLS